MLALGVAFVWALLRTVNAVTRRVTGGSMHPTLRDGDLVLTVPAWFRELRPGQVVILADPRRPERRTIKRITATAGQWASLPQGPGRVPPHRIAVEGDDAAASTDSRTYGTVSDDLVERHVVGRLWPPRLTW